MDDIAALIELEESLFRGVEGYAISTTGRINAGRDKDHAFTYGEVTPASVVTILDLVKPQPHETLCDLGSGTGKLVVLAAAHVPLKKSIGIELLPELHEAAANAGDHYQKNIQPGFTDLRRDTELEFRQEDIFDSDFSEADVVVSHCCTCFDDKLMEKLDACLAKTKPGTRIVTVTRALNMPELERVATSSCEMGWGHATLHVYRRI